MLSPQRNFEEHGIWMNVRGGRLRLYQPSRMVHGPRTRDTYASLVAESKYIFESYCKISFLSDDTASIGGTISLLHRTLCVSGSKTSHTMINIPIQPNALPPELVEGILVYLPISAVIEIYGKKPYMSDCLSQSPNWRHLFSTHEGREAFLRVYSLFHEFHELIYYKPFEHGLIHRHIDLILPYSHSASQNWSRRVDPVLDLYHHLEGLAKVLTANIDINFFSSAQ